MTDREQLGEPIADPSRHIAAVIGGLLGLHTDAVVNLLAEDPRDGVALSVFRDAVKARTAYRALVPKITLTITIGPEPGSLGALVLLPPPPPPPDLPPERDLPAGREINVWHPALGYVRALAGKKPLR